MWDRPLILSFSPRWLPVRDRGSVAHVAAQDAFRGRANTRDSESHWSPASRISFMSPHVRRRYLVLAGLGLTLVMSVTVPLLTRALGPMTGYLSVLALYWVVFCIPVSVLFGSGPDRVGIDLRWSPGWIGATALALPAAVLIATGPGRWIGAQPGILAVAGLSALINGPLEELAWRRTFRANSEGRLAFELLGLGLFTLWHVPLYFSKGVSFDHGAMGLVGSSLLLGAVWTVMTRRSDSVGWPMVSHALVNVAAFLPFFATNFSA